MKACFGRACLVTVSGPEGQRLGLTGPGGIALLGSGGLGFGAPDTTGLTGPGGISDLLVAPAAVEERALSSAEAVAVAPRCL